MNPIHPTRQLPFPREHGAYGQLSLPLATALAAGRPQIESGCFVAGLRLGGEPTLRAAVIPLTLAFVVALVTLGGREKTLAGELTAAATLSSACVPVAVT